MRECPRCLTKLVNAIGIGDYCPNQGCPVLDDILTYDPNNYDDKTNKYIGKDVFEKPFPFNLGCVRCGNTLKVPGALIFTSPTESGHVAKYHICTVCEKKLSSWLVAGIIGKKW